MENPSVLIVEDDLIIASHISSVVEEAGFTVAESLTKGESAIDYVKTNKIDVILMDIKLAGALNGIETAIQINTRQNTPIIFLTANVDDKTFSESKKAFPVGFIGKPFRNEELIRTLEIVLNNYSIEGKVPESSQPFGPVNDRIFVRDKNKMVKLNLDDILYVEADRNYCKITTGEKRYMLSIPLLKLEKKLASSLFMRIHRSHMVNVKAIDELNDNYVFINGKALGVSKSYRQELSKKLTVV